MIIFFKNILQIENREAAKESWEKRNPPSSSKPTFTFTATKTKKQPSTNPTQKNPTQNQRDNKNNKDIHVKCDIDIKNINTGRNTEKAKQYQKRIEEERADKRWDTYTFFEPHKDKKNYKKKHYND